MSFFFTSFSRNVFLNFRAGLCFSVKSCIAPVIKYLRTPNSFPCSVDFLVGFFHEKKLTNIVKINRFYPSPGREGTPGRHEPPLCRNEPPRVARQTKPPLCRNEHAQHIKMCGCKTGGVLSLNKRFF